MPRLWRGPFSLSVPLLQGLGSGQALLNREEEALVFQLPGPWTQQRVLSEQEDLSRVSGRHHTLLHKPNNSSFPSTTDQPRPQGTQVLCAKGRVVHKAFTYTFPRTGLATAMAGAYQQRARALLDPGGAISLITSRLASSLKA